MNYNKYYITISFNYKKIKPKKVLFEVIKINDRFFFEINEYNLCLKPYTLEIFRLIILFIDRKYFDKIISLNDRINNFKYNLDLNMIIERV
jgi:hypothetical protein